jgi:hypothetical protein
VNVFGLFAKKITEFSGHMIDASRIGNLLRSEHHRYTLDQLLTRGFIISISAVSGFLGWNLNNQEKTHYSDASMGIAMTLAGFVLSHTVVIVPLIKKRCKMRKECQMLEDEILILDSSRNTRMRLREIKNLSLSDDVHARA